MTNDEYHHRDVHSTFVTRHFDHLIRCCSFFVGDTEETEDTGVQGESMLQFRGIIDHASAISSQPLCRDLELEQPGLVRKLLSGIRRSG
jgi:hypothetical protein